MSRDARLAFILLWTLADDDGRLRGKSSLLAGLLFPYDDDARKHIDKWLGELETEGCIVRYDVGKDSYIAIANWSEHQKIDHRRASAMPEPPVADPREVSRTLAKPREEEREPREDAREDWTKDQGRDQGPGASATAREIEREFPEFWQACPRKEGRGDALKAFRAARKTTEAAVLLAGMKRYAASRIDQDQQFTKTPGPWLRAEKWLDEPTATGPQKPSTNGRATVPLDTSDEGPMAKVVEENRRRNKELLESAKQRGAAVDA